MLRRMAQVASTAHALAAALAGEPGLAGFAYDRKTRTFLRQTPERRDTLRLDADSKGLFTFDCGIRHEEVERLLAGYLPGRPPGALTIWAHGLNFGKPPVPWRGASYWALCSPNDVAPHLASITLTLRGAVVPFFERFADLKEVELELSTHSLLDFPQVLAICVLHGDGAGARRFLERAGPASQRWVEPYRSDLPRLVAQLHADHPDAIPELVL